MEANKTIWMDIRIEEARAVFKTQREKKGRWPENSLLDQIKLTLSKLLRSKMLQLPWQAKRGRGLLKIETR
jgi:hypothetical protein